MKRKACIFTVVCGFVFMLVLVVSQGHATDNMAWYPHTFAGGYGYAGPVDVLNFAAGLHSQSYGKTDYNQEENYIYNYPYVVNSGASSTASVTTGKNVTIDYSAGGTSK